MTADKATAASPDTAAVQHGNSCNKLVCGA